MVKRQAHRPRAGRTAGRSFDLEHLVSEVPTTTPPGDLGCQGDFCKRLGLIDIKIEGLNDLESVSHLFLVQHAVFPFKN